MNHLLIFISIILAIITCMMSFAVGYLFGLIEGKENHEKTLSEILKEGL